MFHLAGSRGKTTIRTRTNACLHLFIFPVRPEAHTRTRRSVLRRSVYRSMVCKRWSYGAYTSKPCKYIELLLIIRHLYIINLSSQMHVTPPGRMTSTNLDDYNLPAMDLPEFWKCAVTEQGHLYYYHVKIRIPQWQPPIKLLPLMSEATAGKRKKPDVVFPRNKSAYHASDEDGESTDSDDNSALTLYMQLANMYNELQDKQNNPCKLFKFGEIV